MATMKANKIIAELKLETPFNFIHPLSNEEEFKKELYIAMLCLISDVDGNIGEAESLYIKKLMKTMDNKAKFTDLVKLGLNLSKENIKEFINVFGKAPYSYYFILDSLIISAVDMKILDKELQLIAEITELLGIDKRDLENITKLASIIISMEENKLDEFLFENNEKYNFDYLIFNFFRNYKKPYKIANYFTGDIIFNESFNFTQKEIVFENAKIKLGKNVKLNFNNQVKLFINNCEFFSDNANVIEMSNISDVIIDGSTFNNFIKGALSIKNCSNISITNCKYSGCPVLNRRYETSPFNDPILYEEGKPTIKFENCEGKVTDTLFSQGILQAQKIKPYLFGLTEIEVICSAILQKNSTIKTNKIKYKNCGIETEDIFEMLESK